MALPLLTLLSATARQALPIIQGGVKAGLGSRTINAAIKTAFGKGIRRSVLLDIIRAESGIERAGALLKFVLPRNRPSFNRLPQALTRIRRNFAFVVAVKTNLIEAGETVIQNITVAIDSIPSRGELERLAEQAVEDNQDRYKFEIVSSLLIRGVRAGTLGTLSQPIEAV